MFIQTLSRECLPPTDDRRSVSSSDSSLHLDRDTTSGESDANSHASLNSDGGFFAGIVLMIDRLYEMASITKTPNMSKEYARVQDWVLEGSREIGKELDALGAYLELWIPRNFNKLKDHPKLRDRLVRAAKQRRARLLCCTYNRSEMTHRAEDDFGPTDSRILRQQQSGPRHPEIEDPRTPRREAVAFFDKKPSTISKNESPAALSTISQPAQTALAGTVPLPSELRIEGDKTVCPYCDLPLSRVLIGEDRTTCWREHVLNDLEPYTCLFEECNDPLQLFQCKEEWISHMAWEHTKVWSCQQIGHEDQVFDNPAGLINHFREQHRHDIFEEDTSIMIERCTRTAPNTFFELAVSSTRSSTGPFSICPLCDRSNITPRYSGDKDGLASLPREAWVMACEHIADHLDSIALLSVLDADGLSKYASEIPSAGADEIVSDNQTRHLGREDRVRSLMSAAQNGHYETAKLLIERGVDPRARDSWDRTALHWAAFAESLEVVKLLLESGTDVDAKDDNEDTALIEASMKGSTEIVKQLLEMGARVDANNGRGDTALIHAAGNGHEDTARLLLDHGADMEAREVTNEVSFPDAAKVDLGNIPDSRSVGTGSEKQTALMRASEKGHHRIVKLLLERGADPNARVRGSRETALMRASINGHIWVARLLLHSGADPNARDRRRWNSVDYASAGGHGDILQLLLERGAEDHRGSVAQSGEELVPECEASSADSSDSGFDSS